MKNPRWPNGGSRVPGATPQRGVTYRHKLRHPFTRLRKSLRRITEIATAERAAQQICQYPRIAGSDLAKALTASDQIDQPFARPGDVSGYQPIKRASFSQKYVNSIAWLRRVERIDDFPRAPQR